MAFDWFSYPKNFSRSPSMIYIMSQGGAEIFGRVILFMELLAECPDGFNPNNKIMLAVLASKIGLKKSDKVKQFLELLLLTDEFSADDHGNIQSKTVASSKSIFDLQSIGGKKGQEVKKHGKKMLGDLQGDLKDTSRLLEHTTLHNTTQQDNTTHDTTQQNKQDTTEQTITPTPTTGVAAVASLNISPLFTNKLFGDVDISNEEKRRAYLTDKKQRFPNATSADKQQWRLDANKEFPD